MIFCHGDPQWLLPPAGGQCSELSDWGVTNWVWDEETPPTDLSALRLSSLHFEKLLGKFLCLLQSISMRGNDSNVQMSTCNEEGLKCVDSVKVPDCLNPCEGFIILTLLSDIIINISRWHFWTFSGVSASCGSCPRLPDKRFCYCCFSPRN